MAKNFNANVNPFSEVKKSLAPEKVYEFINSDEFNAQVNCEIKYTKGKIEGSICAKSPLISKDIEVTKFSSIHLNSKELKIDANGTIIRIPVKLIWGLLAIITSILDVCEKIGDLLANFGIRLKSQLNMYVDEFKSSITVNGKTLLNIQSKSESRKHSHRIKNVIISRHGYGYEFRMDSNSDVRGVLLHVLAEKSAEYGWYTVKVDNEKSFRFLYSSK